jgi:DNA polymerase-1
VKQYIFDIECDGFLSQATKVHCIAIVSLDGSGLVSYGPDAIEDALKVLYEADTLVAHNGLTFDLKVLKKLHNWDPRPGCQIIDTLVVSRLKHGDLKNQDFEAKKLPGKLMGSHSLEAWGQRLGVQKAHYDGGWAAWSQEMEDYCRQDVLTNLALYKHLNPEAMPQVPLALEHDVASIVHEMEMEGWPFDTDAAGKLYVELVARREGIEKQLVERFGSWQEVDKVLIPKRDDKKRGYVKGVPVTKYKTVVFNPGSRMHIEKQLRLLGWKPDQFTDSGRAKLDEDVLTRIDIPEAALLIEYLLVQKRLGQIADGDNGWLRVVQSDRRIHARYNACGTLTGRSTHYEPNISQVPSVRAPYGRDCRALFLVPEGWTLIGADMSGLELRCFAHYLAAFDGGEYGKVVLEGDVHTFNQTAAGLETRDQAKTFIYAWLYGAGDAKIGKIVGGSAKQGEALKAKFLATVPAIAKLRAAVSQSSKKGYLKGLDGRHLTVRSEHSALNTLLQSAGAVLCKTWLRDFYEIMHTHGYKHGWDNDFVIVGFIHDEIQVATRDPFVESTANLLVTAAKDSGLHYGFKIGLDSSYVTGKNWAETH